MIAWFFDELGEAAHALYWPIAPVLPDNAWGRMVRLAAIGVGGGVLAYMLTRR